MSLLQHRLEEAGFNASRFHYHSVKNTAPDNSRQLAEYLQQLDAESIHLVCHSLGGLVVRHCLADFHDERIGKVVMLGTPNQGSVAAGKLKDWPGGKWMLGQSLEQGLMGPAPAWNPRYPLGIIAGNQRFGLGIIIPGIPQPSDGTVAVAETQLDGMQDHLVVHTTHFGLLLSRTAFEQTCHFIQHGHFEHD